jgi:phosphate transport system substrate-binding protein
MSFMTATHRVLVRVSLAACCVGLAACSGNQAAKPLNGAGATVPSQDLPELVC